MNLQDKFKNINKRDEDKLLFSSDLQTKLDVNFLPTQDKKLNSIIIANLLFCIKYNKSLIVYRKKSNIEEYYDLKYKQFIAAFDWLISEGYVEQSLGEFRGNHSILNHATKMIPTDKFKELFSSEQIREGYFWNIRKNKRTIHFDLSEQEQRYYFDSQPELKEELKSIREQLLIINQALEVSNLIPSNSSITTSTSSNQINLPSHRGPSFEKSSIDYEGKVVSEGCGKHPLGLSEKKTKLKLGNFKIVFGKGIDEHGRLYHPFQNYRAKERLAWTINGEEVIEVDYSSTHPQILYHELGLPLPSNAYEVPGYSRDEAKMAMMMMINCKSRIGALEALKKHEPLINNHLQLIKELDKIHQPIVHKLYKGNLGLMNVDGRIAIDICVELAKKNIFCYPVHDSFIVAKSNKAALEEQMILSWQKITNTEIIPVFNESTKEKAELKYIAKKEHKEKIKQWQENQKLNQLEKAKEEDQCMALQNFTQTNTSKNGKKITEECVSGHCILHTDHTIKMIYQDTKTDCQSNHQHPLEAPTRPTEGSETPNPCQGSSKPLESLIAPPRRHVHYTHQFDDQQRKQQEQELAKALEEAFG